MDSSFNACTKALVILSDDRDYYPVQLTQSRYLTPVSTEQMRREFKMHCQLARLVTPSSGFNVLKIFGDLAIFNPPLYEYRIGVYIMQSLSFPTLFDEINSALKSTATISAIFKKVQQIPRVISRLHALGYAHSDLHAGNIAFDPRDPQRPIVIDFGRTIHLDSTFSDPDVIALYRMFDYMHPLGSFARLSFWQQWVGTRNKFAIRAHNAVLRATPELGDDLAGWGVLREIFSPITSENALRHDTLIYEVVKMLILPSRSHRRNVLHDTPSFLAASPGRNSGDGIA